MNSSKLNNLKFSEIKSIALEMGLKLRRSKDLLIQDILEHLNDHKNVKYERYEQLGYKGKEGITYLVRSPGRTRYAMKTFRKTKSSNTLRKESELQRKASAIGVAPNIIDVNEEDKFIVMDKMRKHLLDVMKDQDGNLREQQQKQIVKILKKLDKIKVFHGDSNILNYMYKGSRLYIIDFGMSKEINDRLIKKLGTSNPNIDIGLLGFILKLKELRCPSSSYCYLKSFISENERQRFEL